jgi:hypothetical protein
VRAVQHYAKTYQTDTTQIGVGPSATQVSELMLGAGCGVYAPAGALLMDSDFRMYRIVTAALWLASEANTPIMA